MAKAYFSFLGTNNYLPCTYYLNDREATQIRFVQEASIFNFFRNPSQPPFYKGRGLAEKGL
jgi:hypothetical protein